MTGQSPSCHWGRCLPQRHDPSSCCTSSSLVWHWKHRRRLFCLDRLVSSGRSVFSSSRGRFTGEASFSDCESDQNNTFGVRVSGWPGKHSNQCAPGILLPFSRIWICVATASSEWPGFYSTKCDKHEPSGLTSNELDLNQERREGMAP